MTPDITPLWAVADPQQGCARKHPSSPSNTMWGHSTFAQTVRIPNVLERCASETEPSRDSCSILWHRHALSTSGIRLRLLNRGKHPHRWLWPDFVLHLRTRVHSAISSFSMLNSHSRRHGSAKILARIVLEDPCIRSYADIGRKAFGPRSMPVISAIFSLELYHHYVCLLASHSCSIHRS